MLTFVSMIDAKRFKNVKDSPIESSQTGSRLSLVSFLLKFGITPNQVTLFGIVLGILGSLIIARGYLWVAVFILTVSGLSDLLDGMLARRSKLNSVRGAFLDSISDRLVDTFFFGGTSVFLYEHHRGLIFFLPLIVMSLGYIISYERAKAESLGISGKGGIMERAERLIALGVALSFNGFLIVPILWLVAGLCALTATQRFVNIWSEATRKDNELSKFVEWYENFRTKRLQKGSDAPSFNSYRMRLENFRIERRQKSHDKIGKRKSEKVRHYKSFRLLKSRNLTLQ